jgi:hypothetical protein
MRNSCVERGSGASGNSSMHLSPQGARPRAWSIGHRVDDCGFRIAECEFKIKQSAGSQKTEIRGQRTDDSKSNRSKS